MKLYKSTKRLMFLITAKNKLTYIFECGSKLPSSVLHNTNVPIIILGPKKDNSRKFRQGTNTCVRVVDVTKLGAALASEVCYALFQLHHLIGCDTISALAKKERLKTLKNYSSKNHNFRKALASICTN